MKLFRYLSIFFLISVLLTTGASCKKIQEDIGKQFIIKAMTGGRWVVEKYTENEVDDLTNVFTGYEFQFMEDGKVLDFRAINELNNQSYGIIKSELDK